MRIILALLKIVTELLLKRLIKSPLIKRAVSLLNYTMSSQALMYYIINFLSNVRLRDL